MGKLNITELCRQLRRNETSSEKQLWIALSSRKFAGLKFRRQHPFVYSNVQSKKCFFVADFYCAQHKAIIELDGKIHDFQKDYDANRDSILKQLGLRIIRIRNEELSKNFDGVLTRITNFLNDA